MGNHHAEEDIEAYENKKKEISRKQKEYWDSLSKDQQIEELEHRLKVANQSAREIMADLQMSGLLRPIWIVSCNIKNITEKWKD